MDTLLQTTRDYYQRTFAAHGDSPRGVDWNSAAGQELRFARLAAILELGEAPRPFTILDVGCGTGALLGYLRGLFPADSFHYTGVDLVAEMIALARDKHPAATFLHGELDAVPGRFDYVAASGIFNVKQTARDEDWAAHVERVVQSMYARCDRGAAWNCLTAQADFREPRLHYADPAEMLRLCQRLSRYARLDQGYPLYEWTSAALRESFVRRSP